MEFAGPHAGCRGELVCGTNNCQKFGRFFDEEDDCCERPNSENIETPREYHLHQLPALLMYIDSCVAGRPVVVNN